MAQGAELGHVEPVGDEPEVDQCDGDIEEDEAESTANGDAVDAVVAETGRDETQSAVVLVGIAAQDKDADEEGLVDDEHEQSGEEETGETASGVVELDIVVG